jgi:hypothetical protein
MHGCAEGMVWLPLAHFHACMLVGLLSSQHIYFAPLQRRAMHTSKDH